LNHKDEFVDFATSELKKEKLSITDEVYLNHQMMRYYVSVEADFDESFKYLVKILEILEGREKNVLYRLVIGDAYFIAYWINQIQHDLVRAREYAELMQKHATKYEMNELLIKANMSLAELTQHEGNIEKAIRDFQSIENNINFKDSILHNRLYLLLSNAFTVYEDSDSAFYFAQKAYDFVPVENSQLKAFSTIHLARGYMSKGEVKEAISLAKDALIEVERLEAKKEIKDINNFLSEANKNARNYKEALTHLENFMKLDKEQASLLSAANISSLETKMAKNKHDHEIEVKQTIIQTKNKQTIALMVFLLFAIGFSVFIVRSFIQKKRDAEIISVQKLEVEEKNKEILDSITYAKRIQSAILPPDKLVKEYLEQSFILYKPKDIVAGDFYWMEHKDGFVLFAAADCTGHGVPGAMVSVVCNNGLNRSVREHGLSEPGKILDKTREIVVEEFEKSEEDVMDGMDIALCALKGKTLKYAGAHNPLWIIRKGSDVIEEIKACKQPIGKYQEPTPYPTHEINLKEGDTIFIFSDGYADQFGGEKGKKLKTTNFKRLLLSIRKESMAKQKELIDSAFEDWKGNLEQLDDVCVIGVRV
jgi:serine phosphatase RsbU (regulator of sigma subunit)